jgi:hypothetical protein
MADTWKSIFKGTIENRSVEIKIYDEGGYRVHTTQGADDSGYVQSDISIPPTERGQPITIDGETPNEIRKLLLAEGFSEAAASVIVGKLSA